MNRKKNTGEENSGNWNSGNWNSGNWNSGNWNSGNWNSGDWNSGYRNSGYWNSGNWNSGNWNSGNWNSGDWNSGNWNSGYFNTNSPDKVRIFNTWIEMTHEEFNEKYNIYANIPLNEWVDEEGMTDAEKESNQGWEQRGGFLRTLEFKDACRKWWKENTNRHEDFLSLPNFDAKIFYEITGIDVEQPQMSDEQLIAELERRGRLSDGKVIK